MSRHRMPIFVADIHYDYEPESNVLPFRARDPVEQARYSALALEEHRLTTKTDAELEGDFLRIATANAWSEFQLATKAMVAAQNAMNEAHNKWLNYDMKLFAANAAEKLK